MPENEILICTKNCEKLFNLSDYKSLTIIFNDEDGSIQIDFVKIEKGYETILVDMVPTEDSSDISTRKRGTVGISPQRHHKSQKKPYKRAPNAVNNFTASQIADFYLRYKAGVSRKILGKEAGINPNTIYQWASVITRTLANETVPTKSPRLKEAAEYLRTNSLV